MRFSFICFSSAIAALAIKTPAASAGATDATALREAQMNLNEEGDNPLQADPRRLSGGNAKTCNVAFASEPNLTATFSETKLQASFTCGETYNKGFVPEFTQDTNTIKKCCANPQDDTGAEIAEVLGVQGKAVKDNQTVTVTLQKIPDNKRGKSIYYKCRKTGVSDVCLVALELPPAIGENDCAVDKVVTIALNQMVSSADFKCVGGKMDLEPLEVTSGNCSNKKKTTNAVKVTEVKAQTEFRVTVDQLPSHTEQLCYTCSYAEVPSVEDTQTTTRTCSVIVTVDGTESSTSTEATTSSGRSIIMTCGAMNLLIAMFLTVGAFS
ncbi:hypothetical protein CSUI_009492 [Cystoisospora suis]|uniref:SRS domain-containing protein n=1 Tax=Cystoisospora suis TaxID=483139 RepID=A0A2C6KJV6_9APIC|nr:hypothetical protein CSUI_009492 [Cystoisospora suis]